MTESVRERKKLKINTERVGWRQIVKIKGMKNDIKTRETQKK